MPIQHKRGTQAAWLASPVVLAPGQLGVALDTGESRVGDGTHTWANLLSPSASKVSKGALSFNVRDYGAVGNWTTGSSGTSDTAAIRAALAAAASAITVAGSSPSARVLVPWTTGNGYLIDDTITVPNGVELDMRAAFVYGGPAGRAALVLGSSSFQMKRTHTIRLKRATVSDWLSEADAGVVLRNFYASRFYLDEIEGFTVGVTCLGDTNNGFSYNDVHLGSLVDNKIALDCTNDTGGWCNEDAYHGGRFTVSSSVHTDLDRVGVRITSRATSRYYNNANIFHKPSFELKGQGIPGVSTCVLVEYGTQNFCDRARHESNSPGVLTQLNNSADNWIDFAYSDEVPGAAPYMNDLGASASGGITRGYTSMVDRSLRTVYKADALHKRACYYDGATQVNVPGVTVGTSATTNSDARAASLLVIAPDYLEIPGSRCVGFYLSTRTMKRFTVLRDAEVGFGGRLIVRCYDSTGAIISTAGTVRTTVPASAPAYSTSYGGAFRTGTDTTTPWSFGVSAATDYVFIGVAGGSAVARIRALTVATLYAANPATWLATTDVPGVNYGTAAPTAGTWDVGRRVVNVVPGGATTAWVCSVAGTPGTWVSEGSSSGGGGGSTTPPQVDVITATGVWTKPTGAKSHRVLLIGGGSAGGSGRRGANLTVCCGGGGGGGAGITDVTLDAADVPSSLTVTIGAAGVGGAAVTTDDTGGNAGTAGGVTLFGLLAGAYAGAGGAGGTATNGLGGSGGVGRDAIGAVAGAALTTGGLGASSAAAGGAGGGAAGGGISAAATPVVGNGGTASASRATAGTNAAGGVVDTTAPVASVAPTAKGQPGSAGGAGAASITAAAQAAALSSGYGAGGSGGGASRNGFASGAGADGRPGFALIVTSF